MMGLLFAFLMGCGDVPTGLEADAVPTGVEVRTTGTIPKVDVFSGDGQHVRSVTLQEGLSRHWVPLQWDQTESVTLRASGESPVVLKRPTTLDSIALSAPLGQAVEFLEGSQTVSFPSVGGTGSAVGIQVQMIAAGPVTVTIGDETLSVPHSPSGQTHLLTAMVQGPTMGRVQTNEGTREFMLIPTALTVDEAQNALQIAEINFPVDRLGKKALGRPQQRVTLPGKLWAYLLRVSGLSVRPRDRTVPWAYQAVTVRNISPTDLNVVVRTKVSQEGEPDPAFRPRMRDVDDGTGWVSAILRVPAESEAEAVLPIFVDEDDLSEDNRRRVLRRLEAEVSALGADGTLAAHGQDLVVQRGSTVASIAMALGCVISLAGAVLLGLRLRHWLRMPTTTLVTIALFGTLSFVVNAAMQLVGMGVASVLGPFAFILTGLFDDTIRAILLITLLMLRPKAGVCGMAILIGWLLRAVTTGAASPADILYLTGHLFLLEASLWLFGLTRGKPLSITRLSCAFATSFSASIATALAFNVVLYRLFYAEWYVMLNIGLSGVVYPVLATFLAIPVARSLRMVED